MKMPHSDPRIWFQVSTVEQPNKITIIAYVRKYLESLKLIIKIKVRMA